MISGDNVQWHVLRCKSHSEVHVHDECQDKGFESYCPRYRVIWTRRGKKIERMIPFIASYVFVKFDGGDPTVWHVMNDLKDVFGILGAEIPWTISEIELAKLRSKVGDDGTLSLMVRDVLRRFKVGDSVLLNDGPFAGHAATCEAIDDARLIASVKIGLLGREAVLYVPLAWCDPDRSAVAESPPTNRRKHRRRAKRLPVKAQLEA